MSSLPLISPTDHSEGVAEGSDLPVFPAGANALPIHQGNPNDDDGTVIDSFFVETDSPPGVVATGIVNQPTERPAIPTRLVADTFTINGATDPQIGGVYVLAVADIHRKDLRIKFVSSVATDYILVGDENAKVSNPLGRGALRLDSGDVWSPADAHTGPLFYSIPAGNTGISRVTWVSTTEGVR